MRVEYHPLTASDLNNAVAYYNQQRAGLGAEFRSEVYAAIARILTNPLRYAIIKLGIRRALFAVSRTRSCFALSTKQRYEYWSSDITAVIHGLERVAGNLGITFIYGLLPQLRRGSMLLIRRWRSVAVVYSACCGLGGFWPAWNPRDRVPHAANEL